jgi:hypothetical protein
MGSFRIMGIFLIIPMTVLLTISFFVLFTIRKSADKGIRIFGWLIVVLLWISAALFISLGVYVLLTGRYPLMLMMQHMMRGPIMQSPMMPK